jgi:hypothetical protein
MSLLFLLVFLGSESNSFLTLMVQFLGLVLMPFSLSSFLVYQISVSSFSSIGCCCSSSLFREFILIPPFASSCASYAAVDLTDDLLTFDKELLTVLIPLMISS